MTQLKQLGAKWGGAALAQIPFKALCRISAAAPVMLFYHTVSAVPLAHVSPLYRHKTPEEFEADLDWLLGELPPLGLADVLAAARGEARPRGFFITFDDGMREVAEVAAPILQRKGVTAALFVNPPFLDNAGLFYRFKAALILDRLPGLSAAGREEVARIVRSADASPGTVGTRVRAISYQERALLDAAAPACGLDFPDYLRRQRPYLTVEQVARLQREGWAIGAHSMDHPRYATLTLEEQLQQTAESLAAVQATFAPPVPLFAFPFTSDGVAPEFYRRAREELQLEAFFGTGGWYHDPSRRLLNRVSVEGDKPATPTFLRRSLVRQWVRVGLKRQVVAIVDSRRK